MANTSFSEKCFHSEIDKEKLEKLIKDFGKEKTFTYSIKENNIDVFHSDSLLFLETKFENDETISVVIKFMNNNSIKKQFKNEIFMYKTVIYSLNKKGQSIFPRLIYTSPITDSSDMVIVLEDLTQIGFQMSTGNVKMDIEEIRLSLKTLGKLHAEMYTMKLSKPELFSEVTNNINLNNAHVMKNNDPFALFLQNVMKETILRTFKRSLNNQKNKIRTFHNTVQKNGFKEMILKALEPEEPLAIICHGDFNRNNLMFRYEDGVPVECKVIDLQIPCYGSPSIDVGFLLFMNMESSDRVKHWTSLWRDYYDALQERLRINMGDHFVIPSYLSLVSLENDFKRKCFYPYIISHYFTYGSYCDRSTFIPLLRKYLAIDEKDEESRIKTLREYFDLVETDEIIRLNNELTLEYVEHFERYLYT